MKYKCVDCGYEFDDPVKYSEDRTPGESFEGGSFIEEYYGCPICSGDYEEIEENETVTDCNEKDYYTCSKKEENND